MMKDWALLFEPIPVHKVSKVDEYFNVNTK
jgi:hypothetical protein